WRASSLDAIARRQGHHAASFNSSVDVSNALAGTPSFQGSSTGYGFSRQSSGRHSIGVKSRCAMYSGRLKRRMWFDTAHRLRYTLTRFHGDRFDVEACTRQEWKSSIDPAGPFGATMPPRSTRLAIVAWLIVHSG